MHNPTSVLEKETHKRHRDFDIQTDHLIAGRRPNQSAKKKKKKKKMKICRIVDFVVLDDRRVKTETKRK